MQLISIAEAAKQGVERIRMPRWSTPEDHLKIDIINGDPGPWVRLYGPFNNVCNGTDPVTLFGFDMVDYDEKIFLPYEGPLPDSQKYKDVASMFLNEHIRVD